MARTVRTFLGRLAPQGIRQSFWLLEANVWHRLLRSILPRVPAAQAVALSDSLHRIGTLDYEGGEIRIVLDSPFLLNRLRPCAKEQDTVAWIEGYIKPGDVFYDIGANVGAYSFVTWRATREDCTIYAFEPSFSTFSALSSNIALNGCSDRIIPFQLALCHHTGLVEFQYSSLAAGAAMHPPVDEDPEQQAAAYRQQMMGYRLDDLIEQFGLRPPNHIKLDVDGAELSVLRGADSTLSNQSLRSILIEVEHGSRAAEVEQLLGTRGFVIASQEKRLSDGLSNYIFRR